MTAIPLSCPLAPSDSSSVPGSPWELLGGPRGHLCGAQRWQCQTIFPPPCCCRFQGDEVSRIQRCTKQSPLPFHSPITHTRFNCHPRAISHQEKLIWCETQGLQEAGTSGTASQAEEETVAPSPSAPHPTGQFSWAQSEGAMAEPGTQGPSGKPILIVKSNFPN